jgi:hypothetical protein
MLNNPPGEMPSPGETPPVTSPTPTPPATPPAAPSGETPPVQSPTWKNGEAYDPAEADKALTSARNEANRLKKEKETLEAKLQAAADAELTEQQRLQKRVQELEQQAEQANQTVRQQRIQLAVERAARELEFVSETAAVRFLDPDRVEFDETTGQPNNVTALLTEVLKENPYLKKPAVDQKPNPIPAHPNGGQVGALTPEQQTQAAQQVSRQYASAF